MSCTVHSPRAHHKQTCDVASLHKPDSNSELSLNLSASKTRNPNRPASRDTKANKSDMAEVTR